MVSVPFPEHLRRFVLTSIPSIPFLEAALLFQARSEAVLDVAFVARNLYIAETAASDVVGQLVAARIVEPADADGRAFRYAPATPELRDLLQLLSTFYAAHLVEVTEMVHSNTARIAQQFADAFRVRKDT
jgi:hypothetical protein